MIYHVEVFENHIGDVTASMLDSSVTDREFESLSGCQRLMKLVFVASPISAQH